jgi:hypothetical protein
MAVRENVRLGLLMLAGRGMLQTQNLLGDPAGRVLGRGPNTDPYPRYERIRAGGELVRSKLGIHMTASHDLVNSILRDNRFGVQTTQGSGRD